MLRIITEESGFPVHDYYDLTPELKRIKTKGTYIFPEHLPELLSSLVTIHDIVIYLNKKGPEKYPELAKLAKPVNIEKEIIRQLENIMDEKGNIRDEASAELKKIRISKKEKQKQVFNKIRQSLKLAKKSDWLGDEDQVSIRNGRAVIPLRASNKNKIRGFIHDHSSTGQTAYVEPEEVFILNNELRELEYEEHKEIIRILSQFSDEVRLHLHDLLQAYDFLADIDFIRAKAKLAVRLHAHTPEIVDKEVLHWIKAYHPLLQIAFEKNKKKVVPQDINLDFKNRIMLISGPNAGGKSACLKMTGLLQYMLQCGLMIPVDPSSLAGIFETLFLDIGDEQSLENDLSTYSSHLMNMKHFLEIADEHSLLLIDEFGSGTEPQLGGAIAEAMLQQFNTQKVFAVITTHYANLKLLADKKSGMFNAAMLFDQRKMKPLYQLKAGKPGSSFAFEIAGNIGLDKEILRNASRISGTTQLDFEEQLQQLEIERSELEKKKTENRVADDFLAEMIDKYEKKIAALEKKEKSILEKAREEAGKIIDNANKQIEHTIKSIRESQAEKSVTKKAREKLIEHRENYVPHTEKKSNIEVPQKKTRITKVEQGKTVRLKGLNKTAHCLSVKGNKAVIQYNAIKMEVPLDQLEGMEENKNKTDQDTTKSSGKYAGFINEINTKAANFDLKLDVRGKRAEELKALLTKYIDEAILISIKEVRILHGKGSGVLRKVTRDYLSTIPEITSFHDEDASSGGYGITVVHLA